MNAEIMKWTQETASKYCTGCEDVCCNASKYVIDVEKSSLGLFLEAGVPVFRSDELERSRKDFYRLGDEVKTKKGEVIPKPALIETCTDWFVLHTDGYCPFYEEKKGCKVHEDSRRPETCKGHPVFIFDDGNVEFEQACKPFNQKEVRADFLIKFSGLGLKLLTNRERTK